MCSGDCVFSNCFILVRLTDDSEPILKEPEEEHASSVSNCLCSQCTFHISFTLLYILLCYVYFHYMYTPYIPIRFTLATDRSFELFLFFYICRNQWHITNTECMEKPLTADMLLFQSAIFLNFPINSVFRHSLWIMHPRLPKPLLKDLDSYT